MRGATMATGRRNDSDDQMIVLFGVRVEQVEDVDESRDVLVPRQLKSFLDAYIQNRDVVHPARADRLCKDRDTAVGQNR